MNNRNTFRVRIWLMTASFAAIVAGAVAQAVPPDRRVRRRRSARPPRLEDSVVPRE
ncbi:MAG: hypothetical protein ABI619_08530 [Betaproteobacteria bacterium]